MSTSHGKTTRQMHESEVYDARAAELNASISDSELLVDPVLPPYPNREHVAFLDFMFAQMGDLTGRRVLEIGCGTGHLTAYLALRGAEVLGIDVSDGMLALARRRAAVNGVDHKVTLLASPVETLDLPDASFDVVLANQVLHHLELSVAMPNISRMLSDSGVALFAEPVLLLPDIVRRIRYSRVVLRRFPSRTDTPDERSVDLADLALILAAFSSAEVRPFQLFTRLQNFRELSDGAFQKLQSTDTWLLRSFPPSRRLARYVVLVLRNRQLQAKNTERSSS